MDRVINGYCAGIFQVLTVACVVGLSAAVLAHETEEKILDAGFRPDSAYAPAFLDAQGSATAVVYPSIVRRADRTAHSFASQRQILALLRENELMAAVAGSSRIDLGPLEQRSQWDLFQDGILRIAGALKSQNIDVDYSLVMEFLVPDDRAVFGIHCYILDQQGRNAFSFLLNSHHQLFVDADLTMEDSSEAGRARLLERATEAAMTALVQQVKAPVHKDSVGKDGYSINSQIISFFDKKIEKIFVITELHESLRPVFMHSFEHSLISGFESNGIGATMRFASGGADSLRELDDDIDTLNPDAILRIELDPLYRMRKDGVEAIVGTDFKVSLISRPTGELAWSATGKVDYIRRFGRRYTAHEGIRKEFAWHTTAAITRAFMADVMGRQSIPIYTVTEERQRHGQRVD